MPNKVTLKRPDGTLIDATPEQASRLALLGYKEETQEENIARNTQEAKEAYYSSPGQKIATGLEGLASGATLGGTDYLLDALGTDVKERAEANPGVRMATETLGAIAPSLLSDGVLSETALGKAVGPVAKYAPSELLTSAAEAAAIGKKGGMLSAITKTAFEGAGFGGTAAADHAFLAGDPITAEAVFHGMGWGAIIGGGLGALGKTLEIAGGKAGEAAEAVETAKPIEAPVPRGSLAKTAGDAFGGLRAEMTNVSENIKVALDTSAAALSDTAKKLVNLPKVADAMGNTIADADLVLQRKGIRDIAQKAVKAAEDGNIISAQRQIAKYEEAVNRISDKLGLTKSEVAPQGVNALHEMVQMKAVQKELAAFPRSVEEFATMSPARAERIFATLDSAQKLSAYPQLSQAIKDAQGRFADALGIDASEGLRGAWKSAGAAYKAEGKIPKAEKPQAEGPSLARKVAGYVVGGKAYVATRAAGLGHGLAYAAYRGAKNFVTNGTKLADELATKKISTIGRIKLATANYLPRVGKAIQSQAGKVSPLAIGLFGQVETDTNDPRELAARRVREINTAAPVIANTLYKAVEPLAATQPALAQGMHAVGLAAFKALQEGAPKDPGAINALKPIWKPSDLHAAVLSRQLAVFHDPVGEAESMLQTGNFDPIKVAALRDMAPNTWQELRLGLLERITDPEVNKNLNYREQIGLSTMLDIPIHTSMSPQYIASSQAIFAQRSQPLKANPRMGQDGGMPDPSDNLNATQAQKSTAR